MGWVPRKPQAKIIDGEGVAKSGRGPTSAFGGRHFDTRPTASGLPLDVLRAGP
jgi:hypothetical protein